MHDRDIRVGPYAGAESGVQAYPDDGVDRPYLICTIPSCGVCTAHLLEWAESNPRWLNVLAVIQARTSPEALLSQVGIAFNLKSICYLLALERFRTDHPMLFTDLYRRVVGDVNSYVGSASNNMPDCVAYVQNLDWISCPSGQDSVHAPALYVVDKPHGGFIPDPPPAGKSRSDREREHAAVRSDAYTESFGVAALFDSEITSLIIREGHAGTADSARVRVAEVASSLGLPGTQASVVGRGSNAAAVGDIPVDPAGVRYPITTVTRRSRSTWNTAAGVWTDDSGERYSASIPMGSDPAARTCGHCGMLNVPDVSMCACFEPHPEPIRSRPSRSSVAVADDPTFNDPCVDPDCPLCTVIATAPLMTTIRRTHQRCAWCAEYIPTDRDSAYCSSRCNMRANPVDEEIPEEVLL